MNPADNINNLFKHSKITVGPDVDKKILNKAAASLPRRSARPDRTGWSIIMQSPITKPLAAAIIVIAGFLSLTFFDKTVSAAQALQQVFKEMENITWMHVTGKQNDLQQEYWISYPGKIVAGLHSTGTITFQQDCMCYSYDEKDNTIVISRNLGDVFELLGDSPLGFINRLKQLISETDGEITQKTSEYLQKKPVVYSMNTVMSGSNLFLKFVVDSENGLPLLLTMNQAATADQPAMEAELVFDYPLSGPQNIYALGVPENATIKNLIPSGDIKEILSTYDSYRNNFASEYTAVVVHTCHRVYSGLPYKTDIIYRDGKLQRDESHGIPIKRQAEYQKNYLAVAEEMGTSFESLYRWWTQNDLAILSQVNLYDGKFYYQCRSEPGWRQEPRIYSPLKNDFRADDDIADLGWDVYLLSASNDPRFTPLKIIENEYANEHNLLCLETTAQGQTVTDSVGKVWMIAPTRKRYFLNPEKDYLCQRFEQEERFDAPWQDDKHWYDTASEQGIEKNPCVNKVREITTYHLTEQGQWYPAEIQQWDPTHPEDSLRTKQIYLKTNPVFPENVFSPKSLPR